MKNSIREKVRKGLLAEVRVKHALVVPEDIVGIKNVFKKNGFKLFIVGGAVRDTIQNEPIKDYDLATDAFPDKVEEIMQAAGYRTLATGKQFGVINVFTKEDEYEIATFRADEFNKPELESFKNYLKSQDVGKYNNFIDLMK